MLRSVVIVGSTYNPRVQQQAKNFPDRHLMTKIKMTVVKCHGYGTLVDIKFNDLEVMGANLAIETIYETIFHYLENTNQSTLRNVYVQLDNVGSNKGYILIICMAILIRLGIAKKVKISYLLVGHTHEDIDSIIGVICTHLRQMDVWTLTELANAIREALSKDGSQVRDVFTWYGIPDYASVFKNVEVSDKPPTTTMRTVCN